MAAFEEKVNELIELYVKRLRKPQDLGQILLSSSTTNTHVSTKYINAANLEAAHIMTVLTKGQNSGLTLKFTDNICLELVHIRKDPGWLNPGAGGPTYRHNYYGNHHKRNCVKSVTVKGDKACLAACLILGVAHFEHERLRKERRLAGVTGAAEKTDYDLLSVNRGYNGKLKKRVKDLYEKVNLPFNTVLNITHIPMLEEALNITVKVVSAEDNDLIVYKGTTVRPNGEYVYLLYERVPAEIVGHYSLITKISTFLARTEYCMHCDVAYNKLSQHFCEYTRQFWCFSCHDAACTQSELRTRCSNCGVVTQSEACLKKHSLTQCREWWFCKFCDKRFPRGKVPSHEPDVMRFLTDEESEESHSCDSYFCDVCRDYVPMDHKCFLRKKTLKKKIQKLLFFDLETDQSSKVHQVNHAHVTYYVPSEDEKRRKYNPEDQEQQAYLSNHEKWTGTWASQSFRGPNCLKRMMNLITQSLPGYTCIAHNLKGFDGLFVLRNLLENNVLPDVIMRGQKILEIKIPKSGIRFIDSFSFLPMGLSKLPSAFGVECGEKGHFPHFFNRPENQQYIGELPDPKFYGESQMSSSEKAKFQEWYSQKKAEGYVFNFAEEMAHYCAQDVNILKSSCLAFRKLMCVETGADPFAYITLASVCSSIYFANFMPPKSIGRVPPNGYQRHRYSSEAIQWLEYKRVFENVPNLRHALNAGEMRIGKFYVDGLDQSTKTVFEYYGCFHHGCGKCFVGDLKNPQTKKRLAQSRADTARREKLLIAQGYKIETMWACQWNSMKAQNPELLSKVESLKIPTPLNPRDAFFGGRTEAFVLHSVDKLAKYQDVTSLYPFVNSRMMYPVGHPEIITNDFKDIDQYFGIVKCVVMPPRTLHAPVLPVHAGPHKKLLFPLCRTCAENFQVKPCTHSRDERALRGTWFSEELKLAVKMGYRVLEVQTVWHFPEKTDKLFSPYVEKFYKMKLCSSPLKFETEEEVHSFIKEILEREGIIINDPSEFRENPGLRQLAKLMLNNLWGRFGMKENLSKSCFVSDFDKLNEMLDDPQLEIQAVRVVNEKIVQVVSRAADVEFLATPKDTNIFVALVTTAWARIILYNHIRKVGRRVFYCDTDSIIYEKSENEQENLPVGPYLGDLTDELDPDDDISHYTSSGPKSYAYRTRKGKTVMRMKGFMVSSAIAPVLCYENITEVTLNGIVTNEDLLSDDDSQPSSSPSSVRRVGIVAGRKRPRDSITMRADFLKDHEVDSENVSALASDRAISTYNPHRIFRTRDFRVIQKPEQKIFTCFFNKRIIMSDYTTIPFGYGCNMNETAEIFS
jgi:hypothetical protein